MAADDPATRDLARLVALNKQEQFAAAESLATEFPGSTRPAPQPDSLIIAAALLERSSARIGLGTTPLWPTISPREPSAFAPGIWDRITNLPAKPNPAWRKPCGPMSKALFVMLVMRWQSSSANQFATTR